MEKKADECNEEGVGKIGAVFIVVALALFDR